MGDGQPSALNPGLPFQLAFAMLEVASGSQPHQDHTESRRHAGLRSQALGYQRTHRSTIGASYRFAHNHTNQRSDKRPAYNGSQAQAVGPLSSLGGQL